MTYYLSQYLVLHKVSGHPEIQRVKKSISRGAICGVAWKTPISISIGAGQCEHFRGRPQALHRVHKINDDATLAVHKTVSFCPATSDIIVPPHKILHFKKIIPLNLYLVSPCLKVRPSSNLFQGILTIYIISILFCVPVVSRPQTQIASISIYYICNTFPISNRRQINKMEKIFFIKVYISFKKNYLLDC